MCLCSKCVCVCVFVSIGIEKTEYFKICLFWFDSNYAKCATKRWPPFSARLLPISIFFSRPFHSSFAINKFFAYYPKSGILWEKNSLHLSILLLIFFLLRLNISQLNTFFFRNKKRTLRSFEMFSYQNSRSKTIKRNQEIMRTNIHEHSCKSGWIHNLWTGKPRKRKCCC